MKVRFIDIYTEEIYSLTVSAGKLMLIKSDLKENAEKSYMLTDQSTGVTCILRVVQGKLQMVISSEELSGNAYLGVSNLSEDCLYALAFSAGKLSFREASVEETEAINIGGSSIFMNRKMLDYLPQYIQEYKEIRAIINTYEKAVIQAWKVMENVWNDQFANDATENGIKRWEKILMLTPKDTYTLEERRFNVNTRLNEQPVFTMETLKKVLAGMCGENGYSVTLDYEKYTLSVKLSLTNENNKEAVKLLLRRMVPANILINISMFNTHSMVGNFTHEQLDLYFHEQLREKNLG